MLGIFEGFFYCREHGVVHFFFVYVLEYADEFIFLRKQRITVILTLLVILTA
jgi:hypothetical protein